MGLVANLDELRRRHNNLFDLDVIKEIFSLKS